MFTPHKNAYLQLVCAINPRIINKAVDRAMRRKHFDPHDELPPAQRLESMQPSLYAPHVDITRASVGFGRVGLRLLNRDLHSKDHLVQLQAVHSVLDEVQVSESALFLISLNIVYRLIDLMHYRNPVIREKVCLIYSHLTKYHQGRQRIMTRPDIVENLMWLILRDRKEIRYAAACTLMNLTRDRCSCEMVYENEYIVENLLKMVNDHKGIVILHLRSLTNLAEWDPVRPLKNNAFQIMLALFEDSDYRIVSGAMDCMSQLCKHDIGKMLADENDIVFVLRRYLFPKVTHIENIISAVGLLSYVTLTTRSKWRAKEICNELTKNLVHLCHCCNMPLLQLRCMQALINLCDCPDVRNYMKKYWENSIQGIIIRTHEEWDGFSETTTYGFETGHNYRTMCIEDVETVKNEFGDNALVVNVHSYLRSVATIKARLLKAINFKSYRD